MTKRGMSFVIVGVVIVAAIILWPMRGMLFGTMDHSMMDQGLDMSTSADSDSSAMVAITLPETLSANAEMGKRIFDVKCAACHGTNAVGQNGVAPPLIHKIYEPSHHADIAFVRAAQYGVRSHHWNFGNMPAIEGITAGEVKMVTAYVREVQRANGIN